MAWELSFDSSLQLNAHLVDAIIFFSLTGFLGTAVVDRRTTERKAIETIRLRESQDYPSYRLAGVILIPQAEVSRFYQIEVFEDVIQ